MQEPSYVAGPSDLPLLGRTIGEQLDRTAERWPDADALVARHQGLRLTYRELHAEAERAGRAFLALGVAKGDRVGVWSPNRVEWAVVQYATAKVGAILVNVNPAYRLHELRHALATAGVSVLVSARRFHRGDYVAMLDELRSQLPDLRTVVFLDEEPAPPWAQTWSAFLDGAERVPTEDLRAREALLDPDDPINIQFTSGTTGAPKGATLTHHNVLNNGYLVGARLRYAAGDRVCVPVPFYHCFGMVLGNLACLAHGACVVLPGESFDAGETLGAIEAERCTSVYGVPTMFIAMLEDAGFDGFDLTSLRIGVMAGSPCPVEVMRRVIDRMHAREMTICYGMTETSPVSFQSLPDDDLDLRVSTVGHVHPWVEAKVVDPDGRTLPRGREGELCIRGYLVMRGYWQDPESTRATIDEAGWLRTGDLAVMREDGAVNIVGRLKDMIIRGGENVYPREIEEFLFTHPKIADVQVIGVPDPVYGEAVCAWVELHPGETATDEEIQEFCRGQIATYKIPRYVRFVEGFPMTVTGKIQKYRMRELTVEELGLAESVTA
ncbi:MAG TPA: AMP-binding protein [Actinomycetota bacterium]